MYIEDLLPILLHTINLNSYDQKLIDSFYSQINFSGNAFTEKQANILIKITRKYVPQILAKHGKDITNLLDHPVYKYPLRTVNVSKHISIVAGKSGRKFIKAQFPYDEKVVNEIKQERHNFTSALWDTEERAWLISLQGQSIAFFRNWINDRNFTTDEEFQNLADQILPLIESVEKFVPMVVIRGEKHEFVNVHPSVPQPTSNDLVKTMFEARLAGIEHWENDMNEKFKELDVDDLVVKFIKNAPEAGFSINLEENSIMDLVPMVQNMSPCLITVPGGNELAKLQQALPMLKAAGIENSEISVLFRLPNGTNQDFNNFVKEQQLNSPLSETTRVVFLSGKVPKPLFESDLKFNCVINFNFYNVHYTLANLVKNMHNVINVIADKKQKEIRFGDM
jgi:hypothetical protein